MNCSDVEPLLSDYYDGELAPDASQRVATHLENCASCADELSAFERLSQLASQDAPGHSPPDDLWNQIRAKLDAPISSPPTQPARRWHDGNVRRLAAAAAVLLAVGIGLLARQVWFSGSPSQQLAADFGRYLSQFDENPQQAQRLLLASFDGEAVDLKAASARPDAWLVLSKGLPAGYSLDVGYRLKLPCCDCRQTLIKRADGGALALFQHDGQSGDFGDSSSGQCSCDEACACISRVDSRLAVSWQQGDRHLTLVGARDKQEVQQFIAHYGGDRMKH